MVLNRVRGCLLWLIVLTRSIPFLLGIGATTGVFGEKGASSRPEKPGYRIEKDTMGFVYVPEKALYAAQTQRSVENFEIGNDIMPHQLIKAFGIQKKSCAMANRKKLGDTKTEAIIWAAEQLINDNIVTISYENDKEGELVNNMNEDGTTNQGDTCKNKVKNKVKTGNDGKKCLMDSSTVVDPNDDVVDPNGELEMIKDSESIIFSAKLYPSQFPLVIYQTGSGTQTNMNVNEVLSKLANLKLKYDLKHKKSDDMLIKIHPNDDVNKSQSTNDSFPTAMHIAIVLSIQENVLPNLELLKKALEKKELEFQDYVKIGRTHLQDATPITLGQEFSGWRQQVENSIDRFKEGLKRLYFLAQGGTAVGTGINTITGFDEEFAKNVAFLTGYPFQTAPNKFEGIASHDALVEIAGIQNTVATTLMKIGNDIRLLSSGPTGGLGEISLPSNEPGSSIMPGKVNPTQSEALTMLSAQVMGNSMAVSISNTHGHLDLNAFKPVMIFNILKSNQLISDGAKSFAKNCVTGIEANLPRMKEHLDKNLMLVTALNEHIGYEKSAEIAKTALKEGKTLKQVAVIDKAYISETKFNELIRPENMVKPSPKK